MHGYKLLSSRILIDSLNYMVAILHDRTHLIIDDKGNISLLATSGAITAVMMSNYKKCSLIYCIIVLSNHVIIL